MLDWQPGWQTADEASDDWYQQHGWTATPPRDVVAEWNAMRAAEAEYLRSQEPACTLSSSVPETLFVPCHPQFGDLAGHLGVELFTMKSGREVVVAFTTKELLVESLGEYQPWVSMTGDALAAAGAEFLS